MNEFFTKNIVLEKKDYEIIDALRNRLSLGEKGFSAALRMIVREWNLAQHARLEAEDENRHRQSSG